MNKREDKLLGQNYSPENAAEICNHVLKYRDTLGYRNSFILGLDSEKFAKMFLAANSEQMYDLRRTILAIYPHDSISVPSDGESTILFSIVEQLKAKHDDGCLDKIQDMHYRFFLKHLNAILSRKAE